MNELGKFLYSRRNALALTQREVAQASLRSTAVVEPISLTYYSQIENGDKENISFDKLWTLAVILQANPIDLYVLSRPQLKGEFPAFMNLSALPVVPDKSLGGFLRKKREDMMKTQREFADLTTNHPAIPSPISFAYYCQIENESRDNFSFDKLWAIAVVMNVNPLTLYVLSRPELREKYSDPAALRKLFEK